MHEYVFVGRLSFVFTWEGGAKIWYTTATQTVTDYCTDEIHKQRLARTLHLKSLSVQMQISLLIRDVKRFKSNDFMLVSNGINLKMN